MEEESGNVEMSETKSSCLARLDEMSAKRRELEKQEKETVDECYRQLLYEREEKYKEMARRLTERQNQLEMELEDWKRRSVEEKAKYERQANELQQRVYHLKQDAQGREMRMALQRLAEANERIDSMEKVTAITKLRQMEQSATQSLENEELHAELSIKVQQTAAAADIISAHADRIRELYAELSSKLVAKSIAARMFQRDALTLKELESIQCSRTPYEAVERLLNILLQEPYEVYQCFLEALKESSQKDVYNRLVYKDFNIDVKHTEVIRQHYLYLIDTMDSSFSGLDSYLLADDVLDQRELDEIKAEASYTTRNEKLLSVLSRKSAEQYQRFLDALDKTGQQHVADVLRGREKLVHHKEDNVDISVGQQGVAAIAGDVEDMAASVKLANTHPTAENVTVKQEVHLDHLPTALLETVLLKSVFTKVLKPVTSRTLCAVCQRWWHAVSGPQWKRKWRHRYHCYKRAFNTVQY